MTDHGGSGRARLGPVDLVLSDYSLWDCPFEPRVAAAAGSGFAGIGLNLKTYGALRREGLDDEDLLQVLDRHGERVVEIEALSGWGGTGDVVRQARQAEERFFHMADVFGVPYLTVVGPHAGTVDEATAAFAGLCDRAGEHGLVVGIEFLPFTNIPDPAAALAIVAGAGRANAGMCIDTWHYFRGPCDWDALAAVPGDRVVAVQFNDGPLVPEHPNYLEDCLTNRRLPGRGEFDLTRFVRMLDQIGSVAPISLEVISTSLQQRPPGEVAAELAETIRSTLRRARAA